MRQLVALISAAVLLLGHALATGPTLAQDHALGDLLPGYPEGGSTVVVIADAPSAIFRVTSYFAPSSATCSPAFTCSNHRSRSSRAAATNRGSFFCFAGFALTCFTIAVAAGSVVVSTAGFADGGPNCGFIRVGLRGKDEGVLRKAEG